MPKLPAICPLLSFASWESLKTALILRIDNLSCDMTSSFWRKSCHVVIQRRYRQGGGRKPFRFMLDTDSGQTRKSVQHAAGMGVQHGPEYATTTPTGYFNLGNGLIGRFISKSSYGASRLEIINPTEEAL